MGKEEYKKQIQDDSTDYGFKIANLKYLSDITQEFASDAKELRLKKFYGDISAIVEITSKLKSQKDQPSLTLSPSSIKKNQALSKNY